MFRLIFEILVEILALSASFFYPRSCSCLSLLLPGRAKKKKKTDATASSTDFSKVMSPGKDITSVLFMLCRVFFFLLHSQDGSSLLWTVNFWMPCETFGKLKRRRRRMRVWTCEALLIVDLTAACCMRVIVDVSLSVQRTFGNGSFKNWWPPQKSSLVMIIFCRWGL